MATTNNETIGRDALARAIAQKAQVSQKEASTMLEATLDAIRESLASGKEVKLVGFGSFSVKTRSARKGVNPRSREPIEVPAKEQVRFSPGKELADAVNKS